MDAAEAYKVDANLTKSSHYEILSLGVTAFCECRLEKTGKWGGGVMPSFFSFLTPVAAIAAGRFDCHEYSGNAQQSQYGGRATAVVTTASAKLGSNSFSTGGYCKARVLGGESGAIIETAERTDDGNGFTCTALAGSSTTFIEITATLWACTMDLPKPEISKRPAPFTNNGLGGNTVAIARAMKGPIPFGVRVCNLDPRTHIAVEIGTPQPISLDPAMCLVLDQPAQVYFRTDRNVDRDVHGAYRLFPAEATRQKPRIEPATKPFVGIPIDLAEAQQADANCNPRQRPENSSTSILFNGVDRKWLDHGPNDEIGPNRTSGPRAIHPFGR